MGNPKGRPSRSPVRLAGSEVAKASTSRTKSYASDGVKDNDIFLLPGTDYQVMGALTVLAFGVRLFKISQPSSVVFDEVQ
jgi:dolichyl-phosphate-mannose-protein mannosyltransferase